MRNAFLIIAHNNWDMLRNLMKYLDEPDCDIYLHVNSLVNMPDIDLLINPKNAKLYVVERKAIVWGKYGVMEAIYELLRTAHHNGKYDYFHLLSGVDLPLITVNKMNDFLEINRNENLSNGKQYTNYIICHEPYNYTELWPICHYNFGVTHWRNKNPIIRKSARGVSLIANQLQSLLTVNRCKKLKLNQQVIEVFKGDAFWSVTEELAVHFLKNEEWAREAFYDYTFAPEEYIFPILVMNSEFRSSIYRQDGDIRPNLRCIDFKRGTPYTWKLSDYDELMRSNCFFARKFDPKVDSDIIDRIYENLNEH